MHRMDQSFNRSWYVRRGDQRRGPYDAQRLECYMLLGRIREGDEISEDGRRWERLDAAHPLYPELLRNAVTPEGLERLIAARERIDERQPSRRRIIRGGMHACFELPQGADRRRGEDPFLESLKARVGTNARGRAARRRRLAWLPVTLVVLAMLAFFELHS